MAYFTFQQYGPNFNEKYDRYAGFVDDFIDYGFGNDRILSSYSMLSRPNGMNINEGYKDLSEKYNYTEEAFDPDLNSWTDPSSGKSYYFDGVNQVKKKAQYVIEKNIGGIMYFDMANDLKVSDYRSLLRAQNEVLSANVDTVMTVINMTPSGVRPIAARTGAELFTAVQDGDNINVPLTDAATPATLAVYSVDGRAMMQMPLQGKQTAVPADGLGRGIYLLRVTQGSESHSVKIAIR